MNIMSFVRALSPKISRQKVEDSVTALRKELEQNVLPRYMEFNRDFRNHKYKDRELIKFEKALQQRVHSKDGLTVIIEEQLSKLLSGLSTIEKVVQVEFKEAIYKDAMNYLQANILQYISLVSFVVRYARNTLTVILIDEAAAAGQKSSIKMLPVEHKRLEESRKGFINALPLTTLNDRDLEKRLSKVPRAFVTEETAEVNAQNPAIDPLKMGFMDTPLNPLFLLGMLGAEWEAASFREAQDEYEAQESLLVNMQLAQEQQNDAGLEDKISRQLETVQKLRRQLDEKERKYGIK